MYGYSALGQNVTWQGRSWYVCGAGPACKVGQGYGVALHIKSGSELHWVNATQLQLA